jgi:ABC-type branched-subunit amino acid transport system ATPase component
MDISKSINEIWPIVKIMFEQHELVSRSRQAIDRIKGELGEMPTEANEIIRFLNLKTKEELENLKIEDRTETILEVKRVLTKRGWMLQLEAKAQNMDVGVQKFFGKIDVLQKKGLPGLLVLNGKLMTLSNYKQRIIMVANGSSNFSGIQGSITSKSFLETLQLDLSIQHEIKHIFIIKPTFTKYTEMDEVYRRLIKVTIPN